MSFNRPFSSILLSGILFLLLTICTQCNHTQPVKTYEPTWESLMSHPLPQWFSDAKFGIFIHWGVYSVPAYHEWYIVFMSPAASFARNPGGPPYTAARGELSDSVFHANIREEANQYHREHYGVDFPYDGFIPMFKAEKFDPSAWADLFKQAGARYVVLTAKHGDEFALWPTRYTHRNAMEAGPHRDLVGELTKAVRSKGMKMGLYHNTTYSFWDERYPDKAWVTYMNNSIKELTDLYHPDILWGDVPVGPVRDEYGKPLGADHWNSKEVIAYFYNHSPDPDEVVTNERWGVEMSVSTEEHPEKAISNSLWARYAKAWNVDDGAFLGDFQTPERRNITGIFPQPWETCDAIDPTSWGYNRRLPDDAYMSTNEIVDYLADIVSKGGNLLINIGPKADGTIPEVMQQRLLDVGSWLKLNGEAIYETTPWSVFGEGPTKKEMGSWGRQEAAYGFQPGDIRFTRKGDVLYAILLEWPGNQITISSLKTIPVHKITLLGSVDPIRWKQTGDGLQVALPDDPVSSFANTLKIE